MLIKIKILDALIRKASKVAIQRNCGDYYIRNIINEIKEEFSNKYPYLSDVSFNIKRDNRFLSSTTIIEFNYSGNLVPPQKEYDKDIINEYKEPDNTPLDIDNISNKVYIIKDTGVRSFAPYLKLTNGLKFEIHTDNTNRVLQILNKEVHDIIAAEEGINQAKMGTIHKGNKCFVEFEFIISMPLVQFLDHQKKGQKKAPAIYSLITHKGTLPVTVVALLVYAWLQKNVVYDYEYVENRGNFIDSDKHMSYGALVRKSAVCEGYAWGFIRIMEQMGVQCKLATGSRNGGHAWAIIKINNNWYNVDPTITSNYDGILINNFLVTDNTLRKKGYIINEKNEKCIDATYENFEIIKNDIEKNRDLYIKKGANVELIKSSFWIAD